MAKATVKTIEQKRREMEQALARLNAFESFILKLEEQIKWEFGSWVADDNGDYVRDENGDYVYKFPEFDPLDADNYYYNRYAAARAALDEIKALV